jgi:hypothetical protein
VGISLPLLILGEADAILIRRERFNAGDAATLLGSTERLVYVA